MDDVACEIPDGTLDTALQFGFLIPIRIYTDAYHVETGAILLQSVEDKVIPFLVASAIQVHDDGSIRIDAFHGFVACLGETGILLHIVLGTPHRPEKAMGGLIAHLHPFHVDVMVFEKLQDIRGVPT